MSEDTKYNGWLNYQTWNVALWIDNDQGSQEFWIERAEALVEEHGKEDAVYPLSQELEAEFDENMPEGVSGTYADLLGHALGMVDWYEIAQHYVDDVEIEAEADEDEG